MGKYDPLRNHLENLEGDEWRTSFPGVEKILGLVCRCKGCGWVDSMSALAPISSALPPTPDVADTRRVRGVMTHSGHFHHPNFNGGRYLCPSYAVWRNPHICP